jgi:hypothetical protein
MLTTAEMYNIADHRLQNITLYRKPILTWILLRRLVKKSSQLLMDLLSLWGVRNETFHKCFSELAPGSKFLLKWISPHLSLVLLDTSVKTCLHYYSVLEMGRYKPVYEVLRKSSGNLNSAREPVVVRPSAARCAEQYPLWISVPTAGKLRGRVLELRAFL